MNDKKLKNETIHVLQEKIRLPFSFTIEVIYYLGFFRNRCLKYQIYCNFYFKRTFFTLDLSHNRREK